MAELSPPAGAAPALRSAGERVVGVRARGSDVDRSRRRVVLAPTSVAIRDKEK